MYLLDTNVVSELRKAKSGKANSGVLAWASTVSANSLYLSVITILELEVGTLLVERRDHAQGQMFRDWLNDYVLPVFSNRILPIDIAVAQQFAKLHVPQPRGDRDALIAATALTHRMTVVTRNVSDFAPMGVALNNPFV